MDLNVHCKSMKVLERQIKENLQYLKLCKKFVDLTSKAQFRRGKLIN